MGSYEVTIVLVFFSIQLCNCTVVGFYECWLASRWGLWVWLGKIVVAWRPQMTCSVPPRFAHWTPQYFRGQSKNVAGLGFGEAFQNDFWWWWPQERTETSELRVVTTFIQEDDFICVSFAQPPLIPITEHRAKKEFIQLVNQSTNICGHVQL